MSTPIENTTATDGVTSYEICQLSGFKVKRGRLVRRWDGLMVAPQFAEKRHPQDFVRTKPEKQRGAIRPAGNDVFVETLYPNGVTVDDL